NFTPRVMANWELDYEHLRAIKPDIIMVSMSAMGQTGPERNRAGFAPTVHAASGLTGLMPSTDGEPVGPGFSYADHAAGLYASIAVLGALEHRRTMGEGQFIDISQTEAVISLLGGEILEYQMTGAEPRSPDTREVKVQDAADLFNDPQLRARGFFVERPDIGKLVDANPVRMSETPAQYRKAAPRPGEDNDYVYRELLGLADAEVRELREQGII
ncbi:MAG: CoA transferase, partial [Dehalococcoidales bacterium]|nr:CoA transferase [Dehalococcoidales bacterium]